MPLLRQPTTEELEDHFFGSGAFQYGWLGYTSNYDYENKVQHFPARVFEYDENENPINFRTVTEKDFTDAIIHYAKIHPTKTFDDLIEDMDAADVDNVIQLIMFGEIRYS